MAYEILEMSVDEFKEVYSIGMTTLQFIGSFKEFPNELDKLGTAFTLKDDPHQYAYIYVGDGKLVKLLPTAFITPKK